MRLYLAKDWLHDDEYAYRRAAVGIPEDISFRTKPQIARDIIQFKKSSEMIKKYYNYKSVYGESSNGNI